MKGGHVTLDQLAAQWLLRASKISRNSFSSEAYVAVLKEAEQFLWAGSEMDSVSFFACLFCTHFVAQKIGLYNNKFLSKKIFLWTGAGHCKESD